MPIVPLGNHTAVQPRRFRRNRTPALAGALLVLGAAVASAAAVPETADLAAMKARYVRPAKIPYPEDNPFSAAKAELGRMLFFDPRLSGRATMSCASCHNPALSWGDGLPTGVGVTANALARRSPSILNLAWAEALFWDGRANSLEEQAVGPIQAPGEMNQSMPKLVTSLANISGYKDAFAAAFPNEPVSEKTIAMAIATFERTVVSGPAPFDRWIAGKEDAIDESAKRGFVTFNTKAHCAACHSGWRFTDDSFHDIGLPDADVGRGKIVQGVTPLQHAFKTPGLRNVAERAPFMHNGSVATLTTVVRHYANGFATRPSLSAEIRPLQLTDQDIRDLVEFMRTLSGKDPAVEVPTLPTEVTD